jgi:hypothetical protein
MEPFDKPPCKAHPSGEPADMSLDRIDFPRILQETLRDAVRRVLELVAEEGLPDFDYFYISFRTDHPGVQVPLSMRDRFPEEMTIVLQHQFWDLAVDAESFGVTLQFNTVAQRVVVPFAALTAFVDPPAEFVLRFTEDGDEDEDETTAAAPDVAPGGPAPAEGQGGSVIQFDPSRRR